MTTTILSLVDTQFISLETIVKQEEWADKFDRIEVWRSMLGENGVYEQLTSSTWERARMPADAPDQPTTTYTGPLAAVQGKEIVFVLNGKTNITYTFTGASPLTHQQAASQLNIAFPTLLHAYVLADGRLVIETVQVGALASLTVNKSDATVLLGLPTETPYNTSFGRDVKPVLVKGTSKYFFTDYFGQKSFYYKTRLYSTLSEAVSDFATPTQGGSRKLGVLPENIAIGYFKAVGVDGRAMAKQEVLIHNGYLGEKADGFTVLGGSIKGVTNNDGYVEFLLVRGITVDLSIPGTSLMRRIKVPTDTSIDFFDLLDPAISLDDDVYKVQRPDFIYANRRSL